VVWTDPTEVKQATELLSRWTEVDVDDALELLGPTFRNKAVRAYAVERLRKANDDVSPCNKFTHVRNCYFTCYKLSKLSSLKTLLVRNRQILHTTRHWHIFSSHDLFKILSLGITFTGILWWNVKIARHQVIKRSPKSHISL
jgi:hypothetical protein